MKNCHFREKMLVLPPTRMHTYRKTLQDLRVIPCMADSSFDRRPFPGKTQVLHPKWNCFPVLEEPHWWKLTTRSGNKSDHPRAPIQFQMLNGGSRCDSESTKITCFVSRSMQFPMLFYALSTVFYVFFSGHFFEKTHLGALDDLHHGRRRNMSTQSFIEGCVCDLSTKIFPYHGIYTIHNCILSNHVESLWLS